MLPRNRGILWHGVRGQKAAMRRRSLPLPRAHLPSSAPLGLSLLSARHPFNSKQPSGIFQVEILLKGPVVVFWATTSNHPQRFCGLQDEVPWNAGPSSQRGQ